MWTKNKSIFLSTSSNNDFKNLAVDLGQHGVFYTTTFFAILPFVTGETMKKEFNITGVCIPEKHYMVDISTKTNDILKMIELGNGDHFPRIVPVPLFFPVIFLLRV